MDKHKNAQYQLRMPAELKEWLRVKAQSNWISMNTQIVRILGDAYHADNKKADCIRQDNQSASETAI